MEKEIEKIVFALYSFRKSKNMTQKEVAAKLKCEATYISMVEGGKRIPSVAFLNEWAKVFNMQVYLLIGA